MNRVPCSAFLTSFVAVLVLATAFPSVGRSQDAAKSASTDSGKNARDDVAVTLPAFDVTGVATDPYNAAESSSGARVASKILDTPATTYVMTPALIKDINPGSLFDLTNYYPGVTPGRTPGQNERADYRGFENFSRTQDNFSATMLPYMLSQFTTFVPEFVERAELVMGPDAILAPTGTPGGTLAVVTKSPRFTPSGDVSMEIGSFNSNKLTVDATGPLGKGNHLAYRIIGFYQDTETYMPGTYRAKAIEAAVTYRFSDTTVLTAKYFGTQQRSTGTNATEGSDGEAVYTADTVRGMTLSSTPQPGYGYQAWNGVPAFNQMVSRGNTGEAELTSALTDRINMRLGAEVDFSNWGTGVSIRPAPTSAVAYDPLSGQQISVTPINTAAIPEIGAIYKLVSRQIQLQNDFAGKFNVANITLQPLLGWAYQQGSIPVWYIAQDKNLPTANLADGSYAPPIPDKSAFTTDAANTPENGYTLQGYTFLRASFLNDRLFTSVGASRTWAGVNEYVLPYITAPGINAGTPGPVVLKTFSNTQNPLIPSVQPWHDSYVAGILGKVTPEISVYYNYSTSATLASSTPLWQNGTQNEFGIKGSFLNNRLSIAADYYDITQSNISYQNPLVQLGQSTVLTIYQDLVSKGEEFSMVGGITKNLSVIVSYANQRLRDAFGRRQRNVPDETANLLLNYHFQLHGPANTMNKANVFLGVIHEGDFAGEAIAGFTSAGVPQQPGYFVPAYTVINAGGSYGIGKYQFNLNVDNALNNHFWYGAQGRNSLIAYPGLNVRFTVTIHLF